MSLFFFGNNFYKNKKTFQIFFPQLLEVYRILLVETTLELIIFYYTFSVINTMFVPCTALLYDSTAATWTLNIAQNSFDHFLWNPSDFSSDDVLCCLWIVFTNSVNHHLLWATLYITTKFILFVIILHWFCNCINFFNYHNLFQ